MKIVEELIEELGLNRLLDDQTFDWDLREGVVFSQAKTRMCLLSTDLLSGVYQAVFQEAGEAWPLIFKTCGQVWGRRLAGRLDKEYKLLFDKRPEELTVNSFQQMVTAYFASHGWGLVKLELERSQETGVVEITLENSIFLEVIKDSEEKTVDFMMAGIFASLFSHLAKRELDCVQTVCQSRGAPLSRFLVTAPERLDETVADIRGGATHEQVLAKI